MRTHKPWFRASKNAWYVEFHGKQVRLAKGEENEKAAYDSYGTMNALDLKPLHMSRWLDAHKGWKRSRRNAVIAISGVGKG